MPGSIDLTSLLDPLAPAAFFRETWQQGPLVQHHSASRFAALVSVRDVDFLVSSLSEDGDGLRLVKDGEMLPTTYVQSDERQIELSKVRGAYGDGYTVILRQLHRRWLPIARLCRILERDFTAHGVLLSGPIGASLYYTPKSARGLPFHYDDHDVITLQIEGTKRWRVFEPQVPFPLDKSTRVPLDACGRSLHDEVLEPGDLIYIPRGFCHDAVATGAASLHLTLQIYPHTWLDLFTRLMRREVAFRQALPMTPADRVGTAIEDGFRTRLEGLLPTAAVADVLADLRESAFKRMSPFPDAGFEQLDHLDEISLDTVLRRRDGVLSSVIAHADLMTLMLPGSVLRAPMAMEPIFRFLIDHVEFRVRHLPDALPDAGKLALAKAMVAEGLLRAAL